MLGRWRTTALGTAVALGIGGAAACAVAAPAAPRWPASHRQAGQAGHARPAGHSRFRLGKIKHVWLIVMENEDEANTFADKSLYLAQTLEKRGLMLPNYYGVGHESLDNYIAMTSGQAPNMSTQQDCQSFVNFPGNKYAAASYGHQQQAGSGCVYPSRVDEIGSQLSAKHRSWKGYMEDMGNIPSREAAACGHPPVGASDNTQSATTGDGYATRHDPFMYFHRVIDHKSFCRRHVVALGKANGAMPKAAYRGEHGLAYDLRRASRTPAYSFITPNLCHDGHDYPCKTGDKSYGSATKDIDHWLKTWVPKIMRSPAYRQGGLIEITFDESDGPQSDSSACCGEASYPHPYAA